METVSKATARYVKGAPTKVRLVANQIRGRNVHEALGTLELSTRRAARHVEKVLRSAVANAEEEATRANRGVDIDALFVQTIFVNQGASLRRFRPRAMGRATPIKKPTSHITVVLGAREE